MAVWRYYLMFKRIEIRAALNDLPRFQAVWYSVNAPLYNRVSSNPEAMLDQNSMRGLYFSALPGFPWVS